MKVIKKILMALLVFLFFNLLNACILSYVVERYLQKDLVSELIKETLKTTVVQMTDLNSEQEQQIQEFLDNPETQELIDSINNDVLNEINLDGNMEINSDLFDEVFDYIIDNKENIEYVTNSKIDVSEIEEFRNSADYQNMKDNMANNINNSLKQTSNKQSEKIIHYYSLFISNKFRIYVITIALIDLLCIALLQNSYYKWLKTLGKAIITCGMSLIFFYFILFLALRIIENKIGILITLDYKPLLIFDAIFVAIGIFSLIVFNTFEKNNKKIANIVDL